MTTFLPAEKGMTIREPSTANFLIDSIDRDAKYPTAGNFQIVDNQSLLNGFFTRLAPVEVVLEWCVSNVSNATENTAFSINVGSTTYLVNLDDGTYTIAAALDSLVALLNGLGTGLTFSLGNTDDAKKSLDATGTFSVNLTNLSRELNIASDVSGVSFPVSCPNLLPYTYIDFISAQLTYNQDLKDTTTNVVKRDTLYRWYFAWDTPAPQDKYGYEIKQGYKPFTQRRYLAFPKQIRWDNIMPIGNISFQVYTSQGDLLQVGNAGGNANGEFEWKMTILVSEC